MSDLNRELINLEFNLLYGRFDELPYWRNIKFENGEYTGEYSGFIINDTTMYLHTLTLGDNINGTSDFTIIPLTLSQIYDKYPMLKDTIELFEENSMNYRRCIFHKLTHKYYLKYLTDDELLDFEAFVDNKVRLAKLVAEREIEKVKRGSYESIK